MLEKNYDDLLEDCTSSLQTKKSFCDNKSQGGWLGFTDKYWMSALIPDDKQTINVNYRHGNNGRDNYRAGSLGQVYNIISGDDLKYSGKLFVGAKKLDILSNYDENLSIVRFTDAIDWGWLVFNKTCFLCNKLVLWLCRKFWSAIIAFTILMSFCYSH